jgi:hypothetical protein
MVNGTVLMITRGFLIFKTLTFLSAGKTTLHHDKQHKFNYIPDCSRMHEKDFNHDSTEVGIWDIAVILCDGSYKLSWSTDGKNGKHRKGTTGTTFIFTSIYHFDDFYGIAAVVNFFPQRL